MMCLPCREDAHQGCPELARQRDASLPPFILAASALCTCQHMERR